MRGSGFSIAGPLLAAVCGIFTAYTTLQPALKQQQDERDGNFAEAHRDLKEHDNVISQAIMSDIKEAGREVTRGPDKTGFAWGIRQALFGQKSEAPSSPSTIPQSEDKVREVPRAESKGSDKD